MKQTFGSPVTYQILSAKGLSLEVGELSRDNGAAVRIWESIGGEAQQWRFEPVTDEFYHIRNVFSGKLLDVCMQGTENGTGVHQWEDTGSDSQLWSVVPARGPGGGVRLCNKHSGTFIDVAGSPDAPGSCAQIFESKKGLGQRWIIRQVQDAPVRRKQKTVRTKKEK